MIPHRVSLAGFLSYKDPQEVAFGSAPLWMLSGANGSGKSAVFDALTYALFGHHRGGSQNAGELINKDSNALATEFDFTTDGSLHRIRRTLKRNQRGGFAGTQQIFRSVGPNRWDAVPDTDKKVGFDRWIHDHVGLDYATFTSSVLLLQGKAEKLLDSTPSGRAEVLAGIVDLERYRGLHDRANKRKLDLKARLEALTHQTAAVPEIDEETHAAAELAIDAAEQARIAAQSEIDGLAHLEAEARRWADAVARKTAAETRLARAEAVLADAVKIEKAFARFQELRAVLPAVGTVVAKRSEAKQSAERTERYEKHLAEARDQEAASKHNVDLAKKKKAALQKTLQADEERHAKATARLRELAGVLQQLRLVDDQRTEAQRLADDLARLPADADAAAKLASTEVARLQELERVLPILERFSTERHDLGVALAEEAQFRTELESLGKKGKQQKGDLDKLKESLAAARAARTAADERAAVARAAVERTKLAVEEFASVGGEKKCRACGSELTAAHLAEEKKKRAAESKAAQTELKLANAEKDKAAAVVEKTEAEIAALDKSIEKLRTDYSTVKNSLQRRESDIDRFRASLTLRHAELPEPYRGKVAYKPGDEWTATAFPERDELIALRRDVAGLDAAKRAMTKAQEIRDRWKELSARAASANDTLARLVAALPAADAAKIREEHRTLQTEETTLKDSIVAGKKGIAAADTEIEVQGRSAHDATTTITQLQGKLHTEVEMRKQYQDATDRALESLPAEWGLRLQNAGLGEHSRWKGELDTLIADGVEDQHRSLEVARGGLAGLRQDVADLAAAADAFPPEVRQSPDAVKERAVAAKAAFEQRDAELQAARKHKGTLDGYREQRAKLGARYNETDAALNRYKILAELLGKDRLQRHLVRRAERQIVDYANAVLDRLSSGQLFLRIVGSDDPAGADKALDLECSNRVAGGTAINVAFLSGSQKFRVAVALALGIGQYASHQHRPIESVIIDEGFGCLDRQGRQVMIQELHNLRGHLKCILLVSHQEEFADAFSDGYRFELENGATRVIRFSK